MCRQKKYTTNGSHAKVKQCGICHVVGYTEPFLYHLCVGETGLGKSTLMDTLFNTKFEGDPTQHNQPGVQLKSNTYELQESNVRLKLTMVNTVGFGDQINKEDR